MHRQAGGAVDSAPVGSCLMQSGGWWPGAHPGLVALFLLPGTLHVTRQAGGAVGVGACRTVAAGSVSVPGICCARCCGPGAVCLWSVWVSSQSWSGVGQTRAFRLGAAQRSCGLRREVTLAHAVLGARRRLCARPVGPVCWSFGRSTMSLPLWLFFTL